MTSLTPEYKRSWEDRGYFIYPGLFSKEEIARFKSRLQSIQDKSAETRKISNIAADPVLHECASHPRIAEIVKSILGVDDIKLYGDQMFLKSGINAPRIDYHQDSWNKDQINCWIAFDDVTTKSACLWYIPGSHEWGYKPNEHAEWACREDAAGRLKNQVPIEVKAGDVVFHHSWLLHCSKSNDTGESRVAYVLQFWRLDTYMSIEGDC